MISYGVSIKIDTASPFAARIRDALAQRRFRAPIAEAGKLVTMDHFRDKEADPSSHATANRLGAKPVGLFGRFAQATSSGATETGAVVSIKHEAIRQRIEGGQIRMIDKMLTIPANAAAYGKNVADFGGTLSLLFYRQKGTGALKAFLGTQEKRKKGEKQPRREVYFWLVRETKPQRPDPTVLPAPQTYFAGIDQHVGDWIDSEAARG
jgi:hypothetical protein